MLCNVSKINAVSTLERYFEKIKQRKYYVTDATKNLSSYVCHLESFLIDNLLLSYTNIIDRFINSIDDKKYKIMENWNYVLIEDELFFCDVFTIKNTIFIRRKSIEFLFNLTNLDDFFLNDLLKARLNVIFYVNFNLFKCEIEQEHCCHFLNTSDYTLAVNNDVYFNNIHNSFMEDYIIVYNEKYTFIEKIIETTINYSPFYDRSINKLEYFGDLIRITEEDINDYTYVFPFDDIKNKMIIAIKNVY